MKDPQSVHILVAEDNDSNFMLIRSILKGYTITRAINGQEAVEMAKANVYDLILMDIKMPIMNGLEATQTIRTFNTKITIAAVTANAFDSDKAAALEAGCNHFITKPINRTVLIDLIERL